MTPQKTLAFLGLFLLMPLVHKPRFKDYWSHKVLTNAPGIKMVYSRDEFQMIKSNFQFYDKKRFNENDALHKVRPLIEELLKNTQDLYSPQKFLSLDESMIRFNGQSKFKVQ